MQLRHKKHTKRALTADELDGTLQSLDQLSLLSGQTRHLLRTYRLEALRAKSDAAQLAASAGRVAGRWCTYQNMFWCSCSTRPLTHVVTSPDGAAVSGAGSGPDGMAIEAPPLGSPRALAFDFEFKPLRFAAVDERGFVRFDALVTSGSSTDFIPTPGVLSCDAPHLTRSTIGELQAELLALQEAGCVFVAHSPRRDLTALEMPSLPVIDVARHGLAPEATETLSLQRMAEMHLGLSIQQGVGKHCAVEDAAVTMALYNVLFTGSASAGTQASRATAKPRMPAAGTTGRVVAHAAVKVPNLPRKCYKCGGRKARKSQNCAKPCAGGSV